MRTSFRPSILASLFIGFSSFSHAHNGAVHHTHSHTHFVVPASRSFAPPGTNVVAISGVDAKINIQDRLATTTIDVALHNPHSRQLEAELLMPVPEGSVLRGFNFEGQGAEGTAKILPRDEARRIYQSIVARSKDPALLEFVGTGLIKSSVFPVPAGGNQKIRLTYEKLLPADGRRIDYVLPRTEAIDYRVPWNISVRVRSAEPLATIYSPSHDLDMKRHGKRDIAATVKATTQPGAFQLSCLLQGRDGMAASLVAYPDPKVGGGYFMLLAAPPVELAGGLKHLKREVTVVIDRSGSMAGEKLEQVRTAATQVLEGLADGESFNIIVYNEAVEAFAPAPVTKDSRTMKLARKYLESLRVSGGTNIHDALVEALRQKPTKGAVPIVLFLTDGLPTIGQTSESAIREVAEKGNKFGRRIFSIGVGVDVNTPLLNRLSRGSRAISTYVLPKEDVEVKVGQVFKRLAGPILAEPELRVVNSDGQTVPGRITDMLPARLPDIFEGDQLVLLGRYQGEEKLRFQLRGRNGDGAKSYSFVFKLDKASTANAFVPRLWANNKIGILTEAIRDLAADSGSHASANPPSDAKTRELTEEIIRLSREFGILTEFTSFFAEEGTDLAAGAAISRRVADIQRGRVGTRDGWAGYNQEANTKNQVERKTLNRRNRYWDANFKSVEVANVQQVNDRAFYKRGDRWVDSQLIGQQQQSAVVEPDRVVAIGSEEFGQLVDKLAAGNRQGCIALKGEILLEVDGQMVLVR
jgi:Ca-activated chloride channel family protein